MASVVRHAIAAHPMLERPSVQFWMLPVPGKRRRARAGDIAGDRGPSAGTIVS